MRSCYNADRSVAFAILWLVAMRSENRNKKKKVTNNGARSVKKIPATSQEFLTVKLTIFLILYPFIASFFPSTTIGLTFESICGNEKKKLSCVLAPMWKDTRVNSSKSSWKESFNDKFLFYLSFFPSCYCSIFIWLVSSTCQNFNVLSRLLEKSFPFLTHHPHCGCVCGSIRFSQLPAVELHEVFF